MSFATFGNDLYTGKRSVPVVPRRRTFYAVSAVVLLVAVLGLAVRGLNLGLEFRGGSEFRVTGSNVRAYESTARSAVGAAEGARNVNVTRLGSGTVRVQTEKLTDAQSVATRTELAKAFDVPEESVSSTFVGPSWGASVSKQAFQAMLWFLALTALVLAIYFRTWKMSLAALIALAHDLVITVGIYALLGFEVSPASAIGFLTVLGYSLYDTVVVFDKVRENTSEAFANGRMTYAEAANLAVNQTFVRSINTTVIGVLPIISVLIVGALVLGPGVLLDLALVLFIGIVVGAYSSIFIATPVLVSLRAREPRVLELAKRAERHRARTAQPVGAGTRGAGAGTTPHTEATGEGSGSTAWSGEQPSGPSGADAAEGEPSTLTGRTVHQYARSGPRNQPKRQPKSKRG